MRFFGFFLVFFLFTSAALFSQEKYITHKIKQGETISSIAEKYNVSQKIIFELNPHAKGILKLQAELKIPDQNAKKQTKLKAKTKTTPVADTKTIEYEVLPKETLFSVAKKFNLTVAELKKSNPNLGKKGLQTGKKITVVVPKDFELPIVTEAKQDLVQNGSTEVKGAVVEASTQSTSTSLPANVALQSHEVQTAETKYGISKRYGITVAELERLNPTIINAAIVKGQLLQVPMNAKTTADVVSDTNSKTETVTSTLEPKSEEKIVQTEEQQVGSIASATTSITQHEVLPKETKYGIAKKYGISVANLEEWNPSIKGALKVGTILQVKAPSAIVLEQSMTQTSSEVTQDTVVVENHSDHFFGDVSIADELIERASDNIGVRYRPGGTTRAGFDCSGLICATFNSMDIKLPRSSIEQSNIGVKITPLEAKKGDLIFFKTRGGRRINHVGMVVDVIGDEIKFIHSSTSQGVIISSTKESYYHRSFAQVNRILR